MKGSRGPYTSRLLMCKCMECFCDAVVIFLYTDPCQKPPDDHLILGFSKCNGFFFLPGSVKHWVLEKFKVRWKLMYGPTVEPVLSFPDHKSSCVQSQVVISYQWLTSIVSWNYTGYLKCYCAFFGCHFYFYLCFHNFCIPSSYNFFLFYTLQQLFCRCYYASSSSVRSKKVQPVWLGS